jgi:ferredoxin
MKNPVVDLSSCIQCGICQDVCPAVFRLNDAGFVEITEMDAYPETDVNDCIKCCPTDCIYWEEE